MSAPKLKSVAAWQLEKRRLGRRELRVIIAFPKLGSLLLKPEQRQAKEKLEDQLLDAHSCSAACGPRQDVNRYPAMVLGSAQLISEVGM